MSQLVSFLLFSCLFPSVVPLLCYTCVFPAISPLECLRLPTRCPADQLCLSSKAVAQRGDVCIVLYEKGCALPELCDLSGEKYISGLNFTYTNECCETNLCNGVSSSPAFLWTGALLSLLLTLIYSQ